MPEDQVIAAAACLTIILQGIRSPQLHTSTLKLLCDLQDIFYEVANTTQYPSPTQSLHTPLRVTPTPTPGNNVHNVNDARNVNDVGHVKDAHKITCNNHNTCSINGTHNITHNVHNSQNKEITRVPLHTRHITPTPIPTTEPLHRSQQLADSGILSSNIPPDDTPARNMRRQVHAEVLFTTSTSTHVYLCSGKKNFSKSVERRFESPLPVTPSLRSWGFYLLTVLTSHYKVLPLGYDEVK